MKTLSAKELRHAYRATFSTEQGKAVLEDLRRVTGVGRSSYVPGDAMETIWRDGRKSIVHLIEQHLDGEDPERREQAEDVEPE